MRAIVTLIFLLGAGSNTSADPLSALVGKWITVGGSQCNSFSSNGGETKTECYEDRHMIGVTADGFTWGGRACTSNAATPLIKQDFRSYFAIIDLQCQIEGNKVRITKNGTSKKTLPTYVRLDKSSETIEFSISAANGCERPHYIAVLKYINLEDENPVYSYEMTIRLEPTGFCRVYDTAAAACGKKCN
ncbi:MAG: hypothetical protein J0H42_10775 [Rhizobiales bacterium]|nr:hypothetical protein [Hyphomicrobiales bacterium]